MNKLFSAFNMNNPIEKILFLVGGIAFVGGLLFYAFQGIGGVFKSDGINITAVLMIFGFMFFLYSINGMFLKLKRFLDFYAESYFERFCQCKERWADIAIKEAEAIKAKNEAVHTLHSGSVGIVHIDHKRDTTTFLQPQHHKYDQRVEIADGDAPGSDQVEYKPLMPFIDKALSAYIWGDQDAGKTTLIHEIMRRRLDDGDRVIAVDPHATLNPPLPKGVELIGSGLEYGEIDDFFEWVITENKRRYNEYEYGDYIEPISIFVDEYTNLEMDCKNQQKFVRKALTEFRKSKLKVVLGAHEKTARITGTKGYHKIATNGFLYVEILKDMETEERVATVIKGTSKYLCRVPWMGGDTSIDGKNGSDGQRKQPIFNDCNPSNRQTVKPSEVRRIGLDASQDESAILSMHLAGDGEYKIAKEIHGHDGGSQAKRVKKILKQRWGVGI